MSVITEIQQITAMCNLLQLCYSAQQHKLATMKQLSLSLQADRASNV